MMNPSAFYSVFLAESYSHLPYRNNILGTDGLGAPAAPSHLRPRPKNRAHKILCARTKLFRPPGVAKILLRYGIIIDQPACETVLKTKTRIKYFLKLIVDV